MQATFNRNSLAKALAACCRVAPTRTPKLVLRCVHITSDGTISATDLDTVGIQLKVPCESKDHGSVIIDAELLRKIVDASIGDDVAIEASANECEVTTGGNSYQVPFEDANAFPTIPDAQGNPTFTITAEQLQEGVKLTSFAAATESARYALTGVNFDFSDVPTMVATDGKRMSSLPLECTAEKINSPHVVPVEALRTFCGLAEGTASVWLEKTSASFQCDGVHVYARLVEGRYPTWREVLPKKTSNSFPLNIGTFARALKQVSIATDGDSKGIDLKFAKGICSMRGKSESHGRAEITMPVVYGVDFGVTLDPKLVLDLLSRLPADEDLTFKSTKDNTICVLEHGKLVHLIVPLTRGESQ